MKQSGNKILVIVLIVIAALAIAGGVFAYAFLATDIFKSEQELFAKYLIQNVGELTQTVNLNKVDELEEKLKQHKYEETITMSYTEKGETLAIGTTTIDIQRDPTIKKEYARISLETQKPEEILEIEYMHEDDMYSIGFTNAVKQFLSVENRNLKELARKLGLEEEIVELLPDTIDFENLPLDKLKFSNEEISEETIKYVSTLYHNIPKEKYTKNKNTVITVNGKTITTNAYILTLNMQDIKTLTLKLLETLKQDEIILSKLQTLEQIIKEYINELESEEELSLKDSFTEELQVMIDELAEEEITEEENIIFTIYEENRKTVRIKLEEGLEYITLDTTDVEGKKQIDMNYTNIDEDNTQKSNVITFIKENDNKLIIKLNNVEGEEQQSNEIAIELIEKEDNVTLNITIYDEEGKTDFSRNIKFVQEIDYKVELESSNNVVLNKLSQEQILTIFTLVGEKLNTEYIENFKIEHIAPFKIVIEPIISGFDIGFGQAALEKDELSDTEIETFNSKFTDYEGEKVSTSDVNTLLNIVFSHNQMEANNLTEKYVVITGDIELESDATEKAKVEGNKTYTVECKKKENGLIHEIVIAETEDNNSISDMLEGANSFIENN